ncbi:putative protein FAM90A26 [Hyaena hyaena]|uniref:putative protein FAM90A26 n=1 Tax=Hyaena hyaena TaxID=95912 RepID=UPI0019219FEF|nr:putative protein FAM90A26 [Hyaena hyaena]
MARGVRQHGPSGPLKALKGKTQRRVPVAPRVPRPEDEDPRLKCKDCGAFGHKASSTRCPMKRWDGSLGPQALGSRKLKENVQPGHERNQHRPGPLDQAEREEEERQSLALRVPSCGWVHGRVCRPCRKERPLREVRTVFDPVGMTPPHACCQQKGRNPEIHVRGRLTCPSKELGQMARGVRQHGPSGPLKALKGKTQRRVPVAPRVPRPEDEDPRLKCKDCSAFGHKVSSTRCPMNGSLASEALAHIAFSCLETSSEHLANRWTPPRWASREGPQAVSKAHGLGHAQAPAMRPEVESPPPATRRAPVAQPHMQAPAKRWAPIPDETCQSPRKKARWSPFQQPPRSAGSTHVGLAQSLCLPARGSACGPPGAACATRKTPASVHGLGLQPPRPRPQLDVVRPCTVPPCPPCPQAPGQPVRMVFRRLYKGGWSSSFLAAPSPPPPPERPAHPAQGPPVTHVPQGPCVPVPRSVLYDDLQLSSSLYDYDWL